MQFMEFGDFKWICGAVTGDVSGDECYLADIFDVSLFDLFERGEGFFDFVEEEDFADRNESSVKIDFVAKQEV